MSIFKHKFVSLIVETPSGPFPTFVNPAMVCRISQNPSNPAQVILRLADNTPIVVIGSLNQVAKKLGIDLY